MDAINSSVKSTLIVSGRDGLGLVKELYGNQITPNCSICNIIVYCNNAKMLIEAQKDFDQETYDINIEFAGDKNELLNKIGL